MKELSIADLIALIKFNVDYTDKTDDIITDETKQTLKDVTQACFVELGIRVKKIMA
jgi:hypothetical protein